MSKFKFIFILFIFCSLVMFGCDLPTIQQQQTQPTTKYEITLDKENLELSVGEEATLVATLLADGEACDDSVTWSSNNATVASVSNGKVTANAEGVAIIVASAHDVSDVVVVTVSSTETTLKISATYLDVQKGATVQLDAWLTNSDNQSISYKSSDSSIATVDANGLITAVEEGTANITVSAGENFTAVCVVNVIPNYEVIFPQMETDVFVGDTINLNTVVKVDGVATSEQAEISGEGFTTNGNVITVVGDGKITVTVKYKSISLSQTFTAWNKVTTVEEFLAMKNNLDGYFKLMNDLDFGGAKVKAFTSYESSKANANSVWSGTFDGQNHTIMNIQPVPDDLGNNASIFGYMVQGSAVKNVNFIGVKGEDRFSVVSSWCHGLIENVYIDMEYISTSPKATTANTPAATLVREVQRDAVIRNCVVKLSLVEGADTTYFASLAGKVVFNALIANCYILCDASLPIAYTGADYVKPSVKLLNSLDDLNLLINSNETFGSNWTVVNGQYPHVGSIDSSISVNEDIVVYAGSSLQLVVNSKLNSSYSLVKNASGVTLSKDGLLTVGSNVADGTVLQILVANNYGGEATINVTVDASSIEVTGGNNLSLDYIEGSTNTSIAHGVSVKVDNVAITSGLSFVSTNEAVATVDSSNINLKGAGTTTINVIYNGTKIHSFDVTILVWKTIKTAEEFLAIGTNQTTMSYNYKLMNDIDFKGAEIHSFASKNVGVSSTATNKLYFSGKFDGQGHTLMNFTLLKPTDGNVDVGLFGSLGGNAVIKNLNVIGVKTLSVGGVIASFIDGGSTVENCYVDVTVHAMTYKADGSLQNLQKNVNGGAFAWRINDAKSKLVNCISVVRITVTDTTHVTALETWYGAFVGANYGTIENCQAIVLTDHTLKEYTSPAATATVMTNSKVYSSISAFYASEKQSGYSNLWTFDSNKTALPHLGTFDGSIDNSEGVAYIGESVQLTKNNILTYSLVDPVEGVTLTSDGLLTLANTVTFGTTVEVLVTNNYGGEATITLRALSLNVSYTGGNDITIGDYIIGVDSSTVAHNVKVLQDGVEVTNGVTYVSSNTAVVIVDSTNVSIKDKGTAKITVMYYGIEVHSFNVTVSKVWHPIYTAEDFVAIGTNQTTMSYNYKLMNDIDFKGVEVASLSSNGAKATMIFKGIFDGQGYTFKNFTLVKSKVEGAADEVSLFGSLNNGAIIQNLNVTGANATGWGGVIASWANNGSKILNCFVEVTVDTASLTSTRVGGAIAMRAQAGSVIKDCISVVTIANTTYYGGVVGNNLTTLENCQAIVLSGNTLEVYAKAGDNTPASTNCVVYTSVSAFYDAVEQSKYSGWVFDSNKEKLPYVALVK